MSCLEKTAAADLACACSNMEGWRTWLATAVFAVFFWAVMTGAVGQQVLYGTFHIL